MLEDDNCIARAEQLVGPLMLMFTSLVETGDDAIANGRILDLIRQVE